MWGRGHQAGQQEDGEQHGHVRAHVEAQRLEAGQVQEHRGAQPPDVHCIEVYVAPGAGTDSAMSTLVPRHVTLTQCMTATEAHGASGDALCGLCTAAVENGLVLPGG